MNRAEMIIVAFAAAIVIVMGALLVMPGGG